MPIDINTLYNKMTGATGQNVQAPTGTKLDINVLAEKMGVTAPKTTAAQNVAAPNQFSTYWQGRSPATPQSVTTKTTAVPIMQGFRAVEQADKVNADTQAATGKLPQLEQQIDTLTAQREGYAQAGQGDLAMLADKQIAELKAQQAQTAPMNYAGRLVLSSKSGAKSALGGAANALETLTEYFVDKIGIDPEQAADVISGMTIKPDGVGMELNANKIMQSAQADAAKANAGVKSGLGSFGLDVASSGANMLTGFGVSALTGIPFVAQMGIQAGGSAAHNAAQQGKPIEQQMLYGSLSGVVEGAIESIGGIGASKALKAAASKGAVKLLSSLSPKLTLAIGKISSSVLGRILGSAISESAEEGLSYQADRFLQELVLDNNVPNDIKDMSYEMLVGGALGGVFGGGTAILNKAEPVKAPKVKTLAELNAAINKTIAESADIPIAPRSVPTQQNTPLAPIVRNTPNVLAPQAPVNNGNIPAANSTPTAPTGANILGNVSTKAPQAVAESATARVPIVARHQQPAGSVNQGNLSSPLIERGFSANVRTDANMAPELRQSFSTNPETYTRLANADTLAAAQTEFNNKSAVQIYADIKGKVEGGAFAAPDVVLARLAANQLVQEGHFDEARDLLATVVVKLEEFVQLDWDKV